MKTTNLKLSKELKANGYPQMQTTCYWCIPEGHEDKAYAVYGKIPDENEELYIANGNKSFAAPTADEILERLPHQVARNQWLHELRITKIWNPKVYVIDYVREWTMAGAFNRSFLKHGLQDESLADAAAKMWLFLKKENLL